VLASTSPLRSWSEDPTVIITNTSTSASHPSGQKQGLKPSESFGCGEAEQSRRPLGGVNRAAHEFDRARNREAGDRKLKKDAEGGWKSRRGRPVFIVQEACAPAPCPIRRAAN